MMSYAQYEKAFVSALLERSELSNAETRKFADTLISRNHVRKRYLSDRNLSELLGSDQMNPDAFANSCVMLGMDEDDFSDTVKIDADSSVFSGKMNFLGVR